MQDFNLKQLLKALSELDAKNLESFFHPKGQWKFANESTLISSQDRENFLETWKDLTDHFKVDSESSVREGDNIFFGGSFDIERKDGKSFLIPVGMRIKLQEEQILEFQTYCDLSAFLTNKEVPI